jgi:hypothetical protein
MKHFCIPFTHVSAFLRNTSVFCSPTSPRIYETLLYSVHPRLRVFMKHFRIPFTHVSAFLWNTSVFRSPASPRFYETPALQHASRSSHLNRARVVASFFLGHENGGTSVASSNRVQRMTAQESVQAEVFILMSDAEA